MNTKRYQTLMSEYINGDISPKEKEELKTYLEQKLEEKTNDYVYYHIEYIDHPTIRENK